MSLEILILKKSYIVIQFHLWQSIRIQIIRLISYSIYLGIFKMEKILGIIPGVLTIPFFILSILVAIFLPDTVYYALGIYLNLWFPVLETFWGYIIVLILFSIPLLNVGLICLLILQSFAVLLKFIFGSYDPSLHGFVTMFPACMATIALLLNLLSRD